MTQKRTIKAYGLFADEELVAIANKEIKIEFLDRGDFISDELRVIPCTITFTLPKKVKNKEGKI